MVTLISTASLFSTVAVYSAVRRLYQRIPRFLFTPILICPLILLALLAVSRVSYDVYDRGADVLTFLLKPATVAFAIPIYKHYDMLKKHALEIVGSVIIGSAAGISTSMLMGRLLGMSPEVIGS
ncbi:LrgB family protein, partial [Gorillibacterium massiliense]|uniref:LrgB family protein n=1 Tax=Gorillibacterium massiliense TaxID=1280390 RepID=UPI0005949315